MRLVIQRVSHSSVTVDGTVVGKTGPGFLVLVGVGRGDTKAEADRLVRKMLALRIFEDENGKINRSIRDVGALPISAPIWSGPAGGL